MLNYEDFALVIWVTKEKRIYDKHKSGSVFVRDFGDYNNFYPPCLFARSSIHLNQRVRCSLLQIFVKVLLWIKAKPGAPNNRKTRPGEKQGYEATRFAIAFTMKNSWVVLWVVLSFSSSLVYGMKPEPSSIDITLKPQTYSNGIRNHNHNASWRTIYHMPLERMTILQFK